MRKVVTLLLFLTLALVSCSSKVTIHLAGSDSYNIKVNFNEEYTAEDFAKDCGVSNVDGPLYYEGFYTDEQCTKRYNFANSVPSDLYVKAIGGSPSNICLVVFNYADSKYSLYCHKGEKLNSDYFINRAYGRDISERLEFKLNDQVLNFNEYEITTNLNILVTISQ